MWSAVKNLQIDCRETVTSRTQKKSYEEKLIEAATVLMILARRLRWKVLFRPKFIIVFRTRHCHI